MLYTLLASCLMSHLNNTLKPDSMQEPGFVIFRSCLLVRQPQNQFLHKSCRIWGRQEKSATAFRRLRFGGWELFYELFTKSLLLEMTHENLIRRLQGFVILAVSGAKPLHCGNEYIVIAALPLELL